VNPPTFSHLWLAVDRQRQLSDRSYRAFLIALLRLALLSENDLLHQIER
jgi:hypothetical protein